MRRKLSVVGFIVLCLTLSSLAGWEYSAVTRVDGSTPSEPMNNQLISWVDGDKAKVEFVRSGNPLIPPSSFLVTKDGGKTMYLVNPLEKTYAKWEAANLGRLAGGAMQMMSMKISTPQVEKLLEEKGEQIAGFATTHYRFRTSYTTTMNIMGILRAIATVTEEDLWTCPELKDAGLTAGLHQQGEKSGNELVDKLVKAELEKVKGFPLKHIVVTTTKGSPGEQGVMKMITEVTKLKKASLPADLFELPPHYEETPMASTLSGDQGDQPKSGVANENSLIKIIRRIKKGT